jgi:hypothetical protein
MNKETKLKIQIVEAATTRFIANSRFTFESLAAETEMKSGDIMELFPNRSAILNYFYESRMILYKEQAARIPGFSEFTLHEKLSSLFLGLLDQFQEYRKFVVITYKDRVIRPTVKTNFQKLLTEELADIFGSDRQISSSASPFLHSCLFNMLVWQFHALILFWANDKSNQQESTLALTDKWCAFLEEVFYSKIMDRGFDLGKFLLYNSPLKDFIRI